MSLVLSTLKTSLENAFSAMKSDSSGSNRNFAKNISKAVADYAESGYISTVDAGTVSAGVYAGKGSGSITVDSSVMEEIVFGVAEGMNSTPSGGDNALASGIASGAKAMITAGTVNTTSTGTVTPPGSSSSPFAGSCLGVMSFDDTSVKTALVSAFSSMAGMSEGGDSVFALQMATAIDAGLKAGTATVNGLGNLAGATGSGKMT